MMSHNGKGNFSDSCIHSALIQLSCHLCNSFVDDYHLDKKHHGNHEKENIFLTHRSKL